jgi:hypothetical protein
MNMRFYEMMSRVPIFSLITGTVPKTIPLSRFGNTQLGVNSTHIKHVENKYSSLLKIIRSPLM